ncbi:hypothetical protein SETIT_5G129100v2 [Setaria italica]|uniref:Uncharacterized protein n=1 Tax=Setaria italica TaxID=4555 RepID=A0A368R5X9_SETIT|nr:hypothetical protein SETIT_5G129100v2 [Setaria italica]
MYLHSDSLHSSELSIPTYTKTSCIMTHTWN